MSPNDLYELGPSFYELVATVPSKRVLVHAMAGFVDAGSAAVLAAKHLRGLSDDEPIVTFNTDLLIDYRARRPHMSFSKDTYTSVELPELTLRRAIDEDETEFLLLTGLEPDVQWVRFVDACVALCTELNVTLAVGLQGIPWAAPHTRPVGLTPHATDRSLIAGRPRWVSELDVPGSADALLEYKLGQSGIDACGFAAHVPHYLTSADYPPGAVALLEAVHETTGLTWDLSELREQGAKVLAEVDSQVADSPETSEAVNALEEQYDAHTADGSEDGFPAPHLPEDELVGEEKLVADFEQYLRDMGGEPPGPTSV